MWQNKNLMARSALLPSRRIMKCEIYGYSAVVLYLYYGLLQICFVKNQIQQWQKIFIASCFRTFFFVSVVKLSGQIWSENLTRTVIEKNKVSDNGIVRMSWVKYQNQSVSVAVIWVFFLVCQTALAPAVMTDTLCLLCMEMCFFHLSVVTQ